MGDSIILFGGHRGMGCTDHQFYQDKRDIKSLPVENTAPSILMAYRRHRAAYVEIDALITKDKKIITEHNAVGEDHFFIPLDKMPKTNEQPSVELLARYIPQQKLNLMTFDEISRYRSGRYQTGEVALLSDILQIVADEAPGTAPWKINIELKHSAGSKQNYSDDGYFDHVLEVIEQSPLKQTDILFSSFAPKLIFEMSHRAPLAHYGALFREEKPGDADGQPPAIGVYTDHLDDWHYQYQPFNANRVAMIANDWQTYAHKDAKLGYMHPETMTVTDSMIGEMKKRGYGLNVWGLFEELNDDRIAVYRHLAAECTRQQVPLTIITDELAKMQALQLN